MHNSQLGPGRTADWADKVVGKVLVSCPAGNFTESPSGNITQTVGAMRTSMVCNYTVSGCYMEATWRCDL